MPTTLAHIKRVLYPYAISDKDWIWIEENVKSKELQILSTEQEDIVVPSYKLGLVNALLSGAHYIVQDGKIIPKEKFNYKKGGLIIIRPGVIHVYIVRNV